MNRASLQKFADRLGIKCPAKASTDRIGRKIAAHLEKEGLPDDLELTDDETTYLTDLGFEFDGEDEDPETEEEETELEEDDEWEVGEDDPDSEEAEDEDDFDAEPVKLKAKAKAKPKAKAEKSVTKSKAKTPAKSKVNEFEEEDDGPVASKRTWNSRKEMIPVIEKFIRKMKKGRMRAEVLEHVQEKFPDATKKQVYDLLSYGKNPKYKPFSNLLVENEKRLSFVD